MPVSSGIVPELTFMIKPILCCLLLSLCAFAQPTRNDGSSLVALERMWNEAQVARDSAAIGSMIGDRFVNTEFNGEVSGRQAFLANFADPKFKPTIMGIDDVKVEMYGGTAIVTGTYHTKGTYGGKAYEHFGRFTDTWIFQKGQWLCVASHSSLKK